MKKIIFTSLTLALISSQAFAKTEGNFLGFSLQKNVTSASVKGSYIDGVSLSHNLNKTMTDANTGVGVSYKYAFNFDKVFVAPGLFFERIGTNISTLADETFDNKYLRMKNRRGATVDVGYDLTDSFSPYLTFGVTKTGYSTNRADYNGLGVSNSIMKSKVGYLFGAGVLNHVNKDLTVGFEYNTQSLRLRDTSSLAYGGRDDSHIKARIDVYKVTAYYHF